MGALVGLGEFLGGHKLQHVIECESIFRQYQFFVVRAGSERLIKACAVSTKLTATLSMSVE